MIINCQERGCRYRRGHIGPHAPFAVEEVIPGFPKRLTEPGHGRYVLMTCELLPCDCCTRLMLPGRIKGWANGGLFPAFDEYSLHAQMQRGDLMFQSAAVSKNGEPICEMCAAAGKATFVCELCKQERTSADIQESYGDPAQHLCRICYETKSAKVWESRRELLEAAHRWDHE